MAYTVPLICQLPISLVICRRSIRSAYPGIDESGSSCLRSASCIANPEKILVETSGSVCATSADNTVSSELPLVGIVVKLTCSPCPLAFHWATATFQKDSSASLGPTQSLMICACGGDCFGPPEQDAKRTMLPMNQTNRIARRIISGAPRCLDLAALTGLRRSIRRRSSD